MGKSGEFAVKGAKSGKVQNGDGCSGVKFKREKNYLVMNFSQARGLSVLRLDNGVRVVLLDKTAAYHFWAPSLTNDPTVQESETGEFCLLVNSQTHTNGYSSRPRSVPCSLRQRVQVHIGAPRRLG